MRALSILWLVPAAAAAQPVVVSPAPEDISITVYRAPDRGVDEGLSLDWLAGYALVTETRRLSLPAGPVSIRFEGVAGNILPQSVILSGLPGLPDEKNYDARLLTPGALVAGALGRQVHIRRTNGVTGEVSESEAIIRAGPDDIVIHTADGFEAFHCTGLNETLVLGQVPDGLSDRPTLSIRTNLPRPMEAEVRLSYLAGQFDWNASYVARLAPDGKTMSLFSWLTLANGNEESFPGAQLLAVAGAPSREAADPPGVSELQIRLSCFPADTGEPPPPPQAAPFPRREFADEIMVTGSRAEKMFEAAAPMMVASQEELGDLKLYRVPERVTVAANAQKQVAFLVKDKVKVKRLYRLRVDAYVADEDETPLPIILRAENEKKQGLGEPLPTGTVTIFEPVGDEWLLVGEDGIDNLPVGQALELEAGLSPDVRLHRRAVSAALDAEGNRSAQLSVELTLSNARPFAVDVEIPLRLHDNQSIRKSSRKLVRRDGQLTWTARVPAQGRARLTYMLVEKRP